MFRAPAWAARWIEAERGRFAPWLAVAMIAGAAGYFALAAEPTFWSEGLAVIGGTAACVLSWPWPACRFAAFLLTAAALGFVAGQVRTDRAPVMDELPSRAAVLTAAVRGVDTLPDGRRLVLEKVRLGPDAPPLQRMVRVRMKRGDATAVAAGDQVQVRALLRPPFPPNYPGAWDQQRDAFFNGLAGGGTALNPVVVLQHRPPSGWAGWVQGVRDAVAGRAMAALPGPAGAIAATLLTGSAYAIPPADRAAFRDAGLAHLLAVAGLHIGIVMGLFMFATRFGLAAWPHAALHWPAKAIAAGAALAAGAAYLVLTGAHVPIIRSFAMASLVTLGVVVGRRALSLRGLALGAAALVLIAPQEVVGPSFQMSFGAVLALIAGYEALRPVLARLHGPGWRRVAGHLAALVLTSLLAGTASAPYGAFHFGHIQLYFIVANMVAVPLTATVGAAVGRARVVPDAVGDRAGRVHADGMGHRRDPVDRAAGVVLAGGDVAGAAFAGLGTGSVQPRTCLALPVAHAAAAAGRRRHAGRAAVALGDAVARRAGVARRAADRRPRSRRVPVAGTRPGASRFVREAWADHLGGGAALVPIAAGAPAGCDEKACRIGSVLLLRNGERQADCAGVALVISSEPARDVCPGAALLDRFTVWRDGAHAVWLQPGGPAVLSDRAARGDRPWVPPPPKPRRATPDLPMAPAETLPPELEDNR